MALLCARSRRHRSLLHDGSGALVRVRFLLLSLDWLRGRRRGLLRRLVRVDWGRLKSVFAHVASAFSPGLELRHFRLFRRTCGPGRRCAGGLRFTGNRFWFCRTRRWHRADGLHLFGGARVRLILNARRLLGLLRVLHLLSRAGGCRFDWACRCGRCGGRRCGCLRFDCQLGRCRLFFRSVFD